MTIFSEAQLDRKKWLFLFGLWSLHGLVELYRFLSRFNDIHGFFKSPILNPSVGLVLGLWSILNIFLFILVAGNRLPQLLWNDYFSRSKKRNAVFILAFISFFTANLIWIVYGLAVATPNSPYDNYIWLALPLLSLLTFVSFEILVLILLNEIQVNWENWKIPSGFAARFLIVFLILSLLAVLIATTRLGIVPSYAAGDWSRGLPAVPLLEWQIILASLFSIGMFFLEVNHKSPDFSRLDLLICGAIWLGTVGLWLSQPVIPSPSALKPHEPNFEIYPFIDAQTYDQYAQSALVGSGFNESIPPHILYVTFLILVHLVGGQSYSALIAFQSLVFAFFPVLLYLFGKQFFGRPIGIAVAVLAALRDVTSNFVSPFTGNLSYSKVLLTEIPTAMLVILFLIVSYDWIRKGFPACSGFLMGGVLGCAMLIRTQVVVILPVVVFLAFLDQPKKIKSILISGMWMALAVLLAVSPWLWRNWKLTGEVIFDSPEYQTINLALRYGRLNDVNINVSPYSGESILQYDARLKTMAFDAIRVDPAHTVWGIFNTFLNHGLNNILLFPLRYEVKDINELWVPLDTFWEEWVGTPTPLQAALLSFYIFLFGLGVTAAWQRKGWIGLIPLAANLAYNLWTSLALLSGQRFMVAMDWSIYFYYMVGVFVLINGFFLVLKGAKAKVFEWYLRDSESNTVTNGEPKGGIRYIISAVFIIAVGASPVVAEKVFPVKYPSTSQHELVTLILNSKALSQLGDNDRACVVNILKNNSLNFVRGEALYPRYYMAGDGERFTDAYGYRVVDENRLVFEFVGQRDGRIVLPLAAPPDFFPHASDVTLGYGKGDVLWFVFVEKGSDQEIYIQSSLDRALCEN